MFVSEIVFGIIINKVLNGNVEGHCVFRFSQSMLDEQNCFGSNLISYKLTLNKILMKKLKYGESIVKKCIESTQFGSLFSAICSQIHVGHIDLHLMTKRHQKCLSAIAAIWFISFYHLFLNKRRPQ